jgi:hypothetical protein
MSGRKNDSGSLTKGYRVVMIKSGGRSEMLEHIPSFVQDETAIVAMLVLGAVLVVGGGAVLLCAVVGGGAKRVMREKSEL